MDGIDYNYSFETGHATSHSRKLMRDLRNSAAPTITYIMRGVISGSCVSWKAEDTPDTSGIYSNYDPPPTNIITIGIIS